METLKEDNGEPLLEDLFDYGGEVNGRYFDGFKAPPAQLSHVRPPNFADVLRVELRQRTQPMRMSWDESKHPRGQPGNPGQFGAGGGDSGGGSKPSSKKRSGGILERFTSLFKRKPAVRLRTALQGADAWEQRDTPEAVEAGLRALGIEKVAINGHTEVGNRCGMVFQALVERGLPPPRELEISTELFHSRPTLENATALYDQVAGSRIIVNPEGKLLDPDFVRGQHEKNWLCTADPQHAILHEYGHLIHHHNDPEGFRKSSGPGTLGGFRGEAAKGYRLGDLDQEFNWETRDIEGVMDDRARWVVRGLGWYGRSSTTEMVAEMFVGLALGYRYSPKLLAAYKKVGGVVP